MQLAYTYSRIFHLTCTHAVRLHSQHLASEERRQKNTKVDGINGMPGSHGVIATAPSRPVTCKLSMASHFFLLSWASGSKGIA